jgi:hypothetical protein
MIINDFAQQQDSNFLPSNPSHKQNEGNNINIPSLTDINNEELSNNCKVTSGTALDESVEEEDVQHNNRERNDGEYLAPPQKASVNKTTVQQKNEDKSGTDPPVEKAIDKLSASINTSSVSDEKNRKNKSKDNDAKNKAGTKYPVIKKLKTKHNDHRMFAEFFSK